MAAQKPTTQGDLLWSGEHWILYLRPTATAQPTAMVSLYHAYTSPAGQGTAAFIDFRGNNPYSALCTDNPEFAHFVRETQVTPTSPFDLKMPLAAAQFERTGDVRHSPGWKITATAQQIAATWQNLQAPLVDPPTAHPRIVFTILVFADRATLTRNGAAVTGAPYPREIWASTLGQPMSSCVFALSETMVRDSITVIPGETQID